MGFAACGREIEPPAVAQGHHVASLRPSPIQEKPRATNVAHLARWLRAWRSCLVDTKGAASVQARPVEEALRAPHCGEIVPVPRHHLGRRTKRQNPLHARTEPPPRFFVYVWFAPGPKKLLFDCGAGRVSIPQDVSRPGAVGAAEGSFDMSVGGHKQPPRESTRPMHFRAKTKMACASSAHASGEPAF